MTLGDAALIAWELLAVRLAWRFLLWWDRQGPPPPPSIFDEPADLERDDG